MKEPRKVQVKPSKKAEKPGKPVTVTDKGRSKKFDDIDSAKVPIDDETAEKGYTVINPPKR
jgi:hypothetical protein